MECIVLAGSEALGTALLWQLEDLGEDWRCVPCTQAEQALQLLQAQAVELAVLTDCPEAASLMDVLQAQPLLAPPYVLGDGFPAPDGPLPDLPGLPVLLSAWRKTGRLPALCRLRLGAKPRTAGWDSRM